MALTPADVHNVAFTRARVGKRGYSEQEVDPFIDLVERELIRHIEEDAELRHRNAELRNRDGGLKKREAEIAQREAVLHEHETEVRRYEAKIHEHEDQVRHQEAALAQRGTPLPQQVAQLRYREAQVAQREAKCAQHEAEVAQREAQLTQRESGLRHREAELSQWESELRQAAAEGATSQMARQQLRVVPAPGTVNGAVHLEQMRPVAAVHGRHDMERMAIRAITDTRGNTMTETVHERTRRSAIENVNPAVASERSTELEQLKEENAELARSLSLLKSAAAVLAAALDGP
ncbi:DivIVA domain-containing protein [Mycobacterium montefiorense]|uniref:DivIVA domain-containing protein n=1 Tax=Mycobacterium montefiorense TaxID=154654 RepID=UPI0021F31C8B|nr:DivIVA domain-containing protein [Mycobacterium montefiorense]MCV7427126.1 DivIVA domain-containing protein [Mycobacterium montefiorense]GLE53003.1 hypothetical protein ATCCBAA256_25640 [Mycobacterium montefiorense]